MTEVKEKWALGLEPGWGGVHSGQKEQTIRVIVSTFRYKAKLEVWMEMAESKTTESISCILERVPCRQLGRGLGV